MVDAELVELTVEEIAVGGDGVARLDSGRVVFLPRTAPGDRVIAELTENRTRWSRGRVVEWKSRGPDRVTPACRHFETCGGCSVQHLGPAAQTDALRRGVEDALRRIGGAQVDVAPLTPATKRFGYRNRVTFTLRRKGEKLSAGYHRIRGPRVLDVIACPLAEAPIQSAWTALRAGWGHGARALPSGRELRLTLRASESGCTALWVTGGLTPGDPAQILAAIPSLSSYWWRPARGAREHLGGEADFCDRWDGIEVPLRPEAFLQVNRDVASDIDTHLAQGMGSVAGQHVLDLYAGVGLRSLAWARAGARVTMVEANADAVATARDLVRQAGVTVEIRHARVEDALDEALPADIVLLNPPRAGVERSVTERLAAGGAGRLVYLSCDPATLARDLKRLSGGWRAILAQPFDAFPQTGHVETVLWLEPTGP